MAASVIHGILFALDLGLGIMHIAEFAMGGHHHPPVDHERATVRVYAGLDGNRLQHAGGAWPDVRIFNEHGVFRGLRCDELPWADSLPHRYLKSGDWADISVKLTENEGQPTYALLSGNDNAVCVAYTTMTRPDGGRGSVLAGNWARACDTVLNNASTVQTYPDNPATIPWYYSNIVIDDNPDPLMCVWLDQNGDSPVTGMSVHFQDFAASTPHTGQAGIDFYCEGNPSLKFYDTYKPQRILAWQPEPYTPEPIPDAKYPLSDVALVPSVSEAYWEADRKGHPITHPAPVQHVNGTRDQQEDGEDDAAVVAIQESADRVDEVETDETDETDETGETGEIEDTEELEERDIPAAVTKTSLPDKIRRFFGSAGLRIRQEHEGGEHEEHHGHSSSVKSPPPAEPLPPKTRRPSFWTKRAEKCEWAGWSSGVIGSATGHGQFDGSLFDGSIHADPRLSEYDRQGRPRRRGSVGGGGASTKRAGAGRRKDTRVIFSNSTLQTATALCQGGSRGPKFVSWAEGRYCNPATNEVLPLCAGAGQADCFDADLDELRVRRSRAKRALLPARHVEDDDMDHHLLEVWHEPGNTTTRVLRPRRLDRDPAAEAWRVAVAAAGGDVGTFVPNARL